MIPRILIRHLTGSKVHRVDQFALADVAELTIGRAPASNVSFDSQTEDTVSRRHAVIKVVRRDRLSFTIADLGSSNGIRVNGRPVSTEQVLGANDLVELGPDGPSFQLAIEADSPQNGDTDGPPTVQTNAAPLMQRPVAGAPVPRAPAAESRRARTRRVGPAALLCLLLLSIAGLGVTVEPGLIGRGRGWIANEIHRGVPGAQTGYNGPQPQLIAAEATATPKPSAPPAWPSVATAPAAMVYIAARWRLYDKSTGQPVYQKTMLWHGRRLPCFVQTANGGIVPWLTTEDDDHANSPLGGVIRGSGFIVGSEGTIITSRHIAAGWTSRYFQPSIHEAALFRYRTGRSFEGSFRVVDPSTWQDAPPLADWIPGAGGPLFRSRSPIAISADGANLEGRNDSLDVLLPSSHASTPARLVLVSSKADIAELRIDVGDALPTIPLANAAAVQPGQVVTAFFFPVPPATGLDQAGPLYDTPSPPRLASARGAVVTTHGQDSGVPGGASDLYELSMAPDTVADGAPVIGTNGAALGVVTSAPGDARRVFAYPAGAARALLNSQ